jgi:hypothetical protein
VPHGQELESVQLELTQMQVAAGLLPPAAAAAPPVRTDAHCCAFAFRCATARSTLAQLRPTRVAQADVLSSRLMFAGRQRRRLGRRRRRCGASGEEAQGVSAPSRACPHGYISGCVLCVECSRSAVLGAAVENITNQTVAHPLLKPCAQAREPSSPCLRWSAADRSWRERRCRTSRGR